MDVESALFSIITGSVVTTLIVLLGPVVIPELNSVGTLGWLLVLGFLIALVAILLEIASSRVA